MYMKMMAARQITLSIRLPCRNYFLRRSIFITSLFFAAIIKNDPVSASPIYSPSDAWAYGYFEVNGESYAEEEDDTFAWVYDGAMQGFAGGGSYYAQADLRAGRVRVRASAQLPIAYWEEDPLYTGVASAYARIKDTVYIPSPGHGQPWQFTIKANLTGPASIDPRGLIRSRLRWQRDLGSYMDYFSARSNAELGHPGVFSETLSITVNVPAHRELVVGEFVLDAWVSVGLGYNNPLAYAVFNNSATLDIVVPEGVAWWSESGVLLQEADNAETLPAPGAAASLLAGLGIIALCRRRKEHALEGGRERIHPLLARSSDKPPIFLSGW